MATRSRASQVRNRLSSRTIVKAGRGPSRWAGLWISAHMRFSTSAGNCRASKRKVGSKIDSGIPVAAGGETSPAGALAHGIQLDKRLGVPLVPIEHRIQEEPQDGEDKGGMDGWLAERPVSRRRSAPVRRLEFLDRTGLPDARVRGQGPWSSVPGCAASP